MKKFLIILLIFITASCRLTTKLWEDSYEESVKNFLISSDGKFVAFLADEYDYIFNDYSGNIRNIYFWQNSTILSIDPTKSYFGLKTNNEIDATIVIRSARVGVSSEDAAYLRSLGFRDSGNGMEMAVKLQGRRYLANKDNSHYVGYYTLTTPYRIKISRAGFSARSAALTARNLVLTPITITLDGVMVFGRLLSETD